MLLKVAIVRHLNFHYSTLHITYFHQYSLGGAAHGPYAVLVLEVRYLLVVADCRPVNG